MTYHEQIAKKMSTTSRVGKHYTYEEILAKLHEAFPDEATLRDVVQFLESCFQADNPGFRYL